MSIFWTTDPEGVVEPIVSSSGAAAEPPITIIERFKFTVQRFPDRGAMYLKRPVNGVVPTEWKVWTWTQYYNDCKSFAKSLIHLNVKLFKITNILGFNSVEILQLHEFKITSNILNHCILYCSPSGSLLTPALFLPVAFQRVSILQTQQKLVTTSLRTAKQKSS